MKNNYTDLIILIDRSGSMESVREDVIGGFNSFIESQRKVAGECTISLYQFDTVYETVYQNKTLNNAPFLSKETYIPRGMTALLDAIGNTIKNTGLKLSNLQEKDRPNKVIVVIQSDGLENSSFNFSREQVFEMIKHQRENYKWDFVFLGANQDAIATATSYGISSSSSIQYANNSVGTRSIYATGLNCCVTRARTSNSSAFFSDEDRQAQNELFKTTTSNSTNLV